MSGGARLSLQQGQKPVFIQMRHSAHTHATLFPTNFFPLYSDAWFASACSENMRHGNLTLLRFDSRAWLGDRCPPNPPFTGWNGPKPDPALPPTQPSIPCTLGLYLAQEANKFMVALALKKTLGFPVVHKRLYKNCRTV